MRLVTNSVAPTKVKETEFGWRIEDVPIVKSMNLAGGYVPQWSIKETANAWTGTPPTLNHPRNNQGEPISANKKPELQLGRVENARFDGEFVRGDIVVNEADLVRLGGEALDIRDALESGEQINVSSQYRGKQLPPGEYDGQYRQNVEKIVQPDSVAILPNKRGKCSVEDGCGINPQMVANSEFSLTMRGNAKHFEPGDLVTWPFGDGTGRGRVAEVFTDPGDVTRTIEGAEVTREVTEDEAAYLVDVWRGEEYEGEALKSGSELSAWDDAPAQAANATDDGVDSSEGMADSMNANQMEFALTDVTPDDVDSYTDDEWDGDAATAAMPNPSESDEAADALDAAHLIHPTTDENRDDKSNWKLPFREGPDAPVNTRALVAARAAISGARGGVDAPQEDLEGADARAVDFLVDAPDDLFGSMESENGDMNGASGHMEDNTAESIGKTVLSMLGLGSGGSTTANDSEETVNRQELIDDITQNSALTEAALEERCNDGLEAIHSDIMANNDDSGTDEQVVELTEEELMQKVEARAEEKAEQMVANMQEQSEKEDLATEIVANSAEYEDTDTVLEDFPTTAALEAKRDNVQSSGATMPGTGATANTEFESDDLDDVSSGVLN